MDCYQKSISIFLIYLKKHVSFYGIEEKKNYANALIVLRNNDSELIPGLSDEFVVQIIQEARDSDLGEEEDKEEFENFVSEAGLE